MPGLTVSETVASCSGYGPNGWGNCRQAKVNRTIRLARGMMIGSPTGSKPWNEPMNPTKRSKLDDLETVRRTQVLTESLSVDAQIQEKLGHLRSFIDQIAQTPNGKADLARRGREFGPCIRAAGESNRRYYGRLRRWLDMDLKEPSDKS